MPGPGDYYQGIVAMEQASKRKHGVTIKQKLPTEWKKDKVPGPGAYALQDSWSKKKGFTMSSKSKPLRVAVTPAPGAHDAIAAIKHLDSKPAITLKPRLKGFFDVSPSPSPSPSLSISSAPSPSHTSTLMRPVTPSFSFGKSEKESTKPLKPATTPGPSNYTIPRPASSCDMAYSMGKRLEVKSLQHPVPGPGTYNIPSNIGRARTAVLASKLHQYNTAAISSDLAKTLLKGELATSIHNESSSRSNDHNQGGNNVRHIFDSGQSNQTD
jgi:hypothetical protein